MNEMKKKEFVVDLKGVGDSVALHNAIADGNIGGWCWSYDVGMSTVQAFSFYALVIETVSDLASLLLGAPLQLSCCKENNLSRKQI